MVSGGYDSIEENMTEDMSVGCGGYDSIEENMTEDMSVGVGGI